MYISETIHHTLLRNRYTLEVNIPGLMNYKKYQKGDFFVTTRSKGRKLHVKFNRPSKEFNMDINSIDQFNTEFREFFK